MKLTKKLKAKWIEALRSDEYGQTTAHLCDGEGNFCCLGVLEHVAMKGEVEYKNKEFLAFPTIKFYKYAGIEIDKRVGGESWNSNAVDEDAERLAELNDNGKTFKWLANWIEENIATK